MIVLTLYHETATH